MQGLNIEVILKTLSFHCLIDDLAIKQELKKQNVLMRGILFSFFFLIEKHNWVIEIVLQIVIYTSYASHRNVSIKWIENFMNVLGRTESHFIH